MQDVLIQAQFLEPLTAEIPDKQQPPASGETSFTDALESRMTERSRKKDRRNDDPDPEQAAIGVQPQQYADTPTRKSSTEASPEISEPSNTSSESSQVSLDGNVSTSNQVFHDAEAINSGMDFIEAVQPDNADMVVQDSPSLEESTGVRETELSARTLHAEESNADQDGMDTAQFEQIVKGKKPEQIQQTEEKVETTVSQTVQDVSENADRLQGKDGSAGEQSLFKTPIDGTRKKSQESGNGSTPKTGSIEFEGMEQVTHESGISVQQETMAARLSTVSEPARTAEAQPSSFLPQVEDGITQMLKSKQTSRKIQLHPEDLGRIQLKLVQDSSGLRVAMHADQADTNQLLERHMHSLLKSLNDAGIQLTGFDIGSRGQGSQPQFTQTWPEAVKTAPVNAAEPVPEIINTANLHSTNAAVDYRI